MRAFMDLRDGYYVSRIWVVKTMVGITLAFTGKAKDSDVFDYRINFHEFGTGDDIHAYKATVSEQELNNTVARIITGCARDNFDGHDFPYEIHTLILESSDGNYITQELSKVLALRDIDKKDAPS